MSGLASKELITCAIEYCAMVASSSNHRPFFLVCCSLTSPLSPTTKSANAICFPSAFTNCKILPSVVFTAPYVPLIKVFHSQACEPTKIIPPIHHLPIHLRLILLPPLPIQPQPHSNNRLVYVVLLPLTPEHCKKQKHA